MIPEEILKQLVPPHEPEDEYWRDTWLHEQNRDKPNRLIALWAAYLRHQISKEIQDDKELRKLLVNSGFIATGIFRAPSIHNTQENVNFPIVGGYQFGAVILHSEMFESYEDPYISSVLLEHGRSSAPLVRFSSNLYLHGIHDQGHVAALFDDNKHNSYGITAAHVVEKYRRGQTVPISCSDCGAPATLVRKAPGLIDAAVVNFRCGGSLHKYLPSSRNIRPASEGETVNLYFGESGTRSSTVMLALQTPSEIISAATPKHFLTDVHGHPGDSGSLVAVTSDPHQHQELLGMYLGETHCEDGSQNYFTYGFSLDLKQVEDIFKVSILTGEFNE